jgi:hypothetical protein
MMRRATTLRLGPLLLMLVVGLSGCSILVPQISTMPVAHNPFPQLSRVAVVTFFNQSDEPTIDGRDFALAYFAELQSVPGFEVVPLGVVEEALIQHQINLSNSETAADEIRRLGNILGVDAVVIGAVTDYSPYYPPRCGLHVEWYATNAGFHEIPAGYGLPWGTPEEEYIPEQVAFEAELALAKAQMATQSPICDVELVQPGPIVETLPRDTALAPLPLGPNARKEPRADPFEGDAPVDMTTPEGDAEVLPPPDSLDSDDTSGDTSDATSDAAVTPTAGEFATTDAKISSEALPANWPDARGFSPPGPSPVRPACISNPGPVMTHTRIFRGHDPEFTTALAAYVDFRDDARFGGWRSYLERSDDFIRFCCHLHLTQMLEARGGVTETRVVQRWSDDR